MKFDYEKLGNLIEISETKNKDLAVTNLVGVNINKEFMPSVANTVGTNLANYKIIKKDQFVYNNMQVARDRTIRIVRYADETPSIISPAYKIFQVIDKNLLNAEFLMLYFLRPEFDRLCWFYTDSSIRGSLDWAKFCNLKVPVPPIDIQEKIVNIYNFLNERIHLKNKINKNLAEIILSNFRRWFVNFEPFKDKPFIDSDFGFIPENWKVGSIGDYCKLKSGFAFKSAWWQDEGIKVIKIKDINQDSIDLSECSCVSSDKLQKATEFKVAGGDLLIAMTGATIGKFSIVPKHDEPLYVNQRVGKFFLGDNPLNNLPFIWSLLKQKRIFDEIINRGQGSAQPNVSPTDIETIEIILPPIEIINQFNNECRSMFKLMIYNSYEITKLTKLRDTLLPKLMSGEIDVSKINY